VPARVRQLLTRHGWLVAIAVVYLYAFPYFPRIQSANELPRVYLVKAIVHDGTFAIDDGVRRWGATADVSPHGHHQYSNKAPGSSLLVVPVYAAVSAVAGEPSLGATMWICRVVSGVIPMLLFLALLARFLARFAPDPVVRRLVLVAYALGSMAMTYSILYFSHQLAAVCIASAWILSIDVVEGTRGTRTMFAVGLLAGCAPLVDYQAAFAGVPVAVYLVASLVRTRPARDTARLLAIAAAGAAIPIVLLLWYHARCFGSPLRTGYDASTTWAVYHQQGFLGITKLRSEAFWGSLFAADNGLLVLSPWLLLALPGAVALWRRKQSGDRAAVAVGAANAVIFIAFVSSITFWRGGWGVGPRYITAMLPFLLPFVAAALTWAHARRAELLGICAGAIVSSIVIYTLAVATFPYWPDSMRDPLCEVTFRLLGDGAVAPNPLRGALGALSLIPYVALVLGLVTLAVRRAAGWRGLAVAVALGALIIGAFSLVPRTPGDRADRGYKNTVLPAVIK
jgi:hypothetical protein